MQKGVAGMSGKLFFVHFGVLEIGFELGLFFGVLNNRFFCNPL